MRADASGCHQGQRRFEAQAAFGLRPVVSFGDAVNDLAMFDVSDECYAVANAVDALKARARAVIDSNDRDGVARYLAGRILAKPDEKTF